MPARIEECGDAALLVRFDADRTEGDRVWMRAHALADSLLADRPRWLVDVLPAFDSVLVTIDPLCPDSGDAAEVLRDRLVRSVRPARPARAPVEFTVPVIYDGTDLDSVAAELGWPVRRLIEFHTGQPWTVRVVASPAGAPLCDGPEPPRPIARLSPPRIRVPAGSVALSGRQCIVYPVASPGGWQVIGRTVEPLADPAADPVVAHRPGDLVQFVRAR